MRIIKLSAKNHSERQTNQIRKLLESVGWNQRQIDGQVESLERFLNDKNSIVFIALENDEIIGYITAQFYSWNRLGQIHGLVVDTNHRKRGLASNLVKEVEVFMKDSQARGVYVDTPVNNISGCSFYKKIGYKQAYIMPEYYDKGLDGVNFLKLFLHDS